MSETPSPESARTFQPVDETALALAARLLRSSRHGTLAVIEPGTGHPLASRTTFACDDRGAPIILISGLAAHTPALRADPRCSLLAGEPGAGDPLAHPRITLIGQARRLERGSVEGTQARACFLAARPKAALYADFAFWRIESQRASLNGGFGRAWQLEASDLARAFAAGPSAPSVSSAPSAPSAPSGISDSR
ncbi:MAG TPA: pyridoxamine 5'-phosphate oxidase family protein [Burkholderiaceae bacterium]|nr:pyridoxamine 5'-phosphate oxidase family protein [Burkholderiaceae bacterium]